MLNSLITGILLILCCTLNTALGASELKEYPQLLAKVTTAPQEHESLPQTSAKKEATRRIISFKTGDIFRGTVELTEPRHNPAELTLHIRNTTSRDATESEFKIEAIAVMKIGTVQTTYGLHGIYDPGCQQIDLYDIQDLPTTSASIPTGILINNVIFEPIGLAGKFTDDGNTIQCAVAYNGNASLVRLANKPFELDENITAISSKKPHQVSGMKQLKN